ncbi:UBP38 hydrolase, partial [Atractosteus spatula]|nr:UBP38 hydrolase [Atractosteus spatula]
MDKILEAVMMSPHSRAVKEGMVRRVIGSAPQPLDRAQCMAMFNVATKLFLLGESQFKQDVGREVLEAFAQHHQQDFEEFFNVRFILDLLQEGYASLGKRSPQIFDYLQVGLRYIIESPSSEELFHLLQIEVLRIVCERPGPELCARIAKLLNCVPSGNLQTVFCQQLIQTIRLFQCQCDGDNDIVAFLEHVTKTSGMLQSVWRTNMATILPSLKELFIVISSPAGGSVPSNALASVVQYVPLELMEGVVRNLTNDKNISDAQMLIAICRMMDWLSWPFTKNIDKWIIALMKGVAAVKKCAILIEVTLTKIEEVFSKLFYPIVREGALSVLSYLLLSFQQSPEAFHLLLPQIPQLISALSAEESDSARHCLAQMVELTHCLLFRFSGFPDLYQPVLELIKDLPVPNEERMKQLLRQSAWAPQKTEQVSFCHRLAPRSQTGKTGLVNLGNTCYMNSVIQALFMASDFRRAVMSLKNCDLLPLMGNLQRLFAFLEHSQRPAISPDSFLVASIPAWFTPGTQQDCSEYLKYLLDRLHEEEKRSHQKTRGSLAGSEENGTLIKKMFGGKMVTRIRCLRCQNISRREEALTDLSLALPPPDHSPERSFIISPSPPVVEVIGPSSLKSFSPGTSGEPISGSEASLSVPDLINFFLSPEMLTGENKYHCQRCSSLQIEVTEGPHYLILTLLRFSFDVVTMRRKKILDNVSIPLVLKIPIRVTSKDPASAEAGKLYPESSTEGSAYVSMTYDLGSVVVHSGLSSESGHYYCYARECDYGNLEKQSNTGAHISSQQPTAENQWFLFNDTRVSFSSFESVSNVTTYFPKDTAYVMFYRLRPSQYVEADRECISAADNLHVGESLHKELSEAITKDNTLHLQVRWCPLTSFQSI